MGPGLARPRLHKTTYAPIYMIYTSLCVRFWTWADRLRGEVGGGVGAGNREFCGPCEIARADRRVQFGAQICPDPKPYAPV